MLVRDRMSSHPVPVLDSNRRVVGVITETDIFKALGPLALADLIGLDTVLAVMNVFYDGFNDPKYRPAPLLKEMVDAGYLGRKTMRGFHGHS